MVVRLSNLFPLLGEMVVSAAGISVPPHDQFGPGPVIHEAKDGAPIENDATVYLTRGGERNFFVQIEVQKKYDPGKLATLRAYHASEVRNSRCGGAVIVLSPRESVAARFRKEEELHREEFAYRSAFLSGEDLAEMAALGRSFPERAMVMALTDFSAGIPDGFWDMFEEMSAVDDLLGRLFLEAMLEERPVGDKRLEEDLSPEALERLNAIPAFRERCDAARAEGRLEIMRESLLQYFRARQDDLASHARAAIENCTDLGILQRWRDRAYSGETSRQIFG